MMKIHKYLLAAMLSITLVSQNAFASRIFSEKSPSGAHVTVTELADGKLVFQSCPTQDESGCQVIGKTTGYSQEQLARRSAELRNWAIGTVGAMAALTVLGLVGGFAYSVKQSAFVSTEVVEAALKISFNHLSWGIGGGLTGFGIGYAIKETMPDYLGAKASLAEANKALPPSFLAEDLTITTDQKMSEFVEKLGFVLGGI